MGYETMEQLLSMQTVSYDRDDQCDGDQPYGMIGLRAPVDNVTDLAATATGEVAGWAQMRNTEYEGDYYDVPPPEVEEFEFANGRVGALATVSFVPKNPSRYECDSPAVRFSVAVQQAEDGLAYRMVAMSHIGLEDSLPEEHEREILATLDTP